MKDEDTRSKIKELIKELELSSQIEKSFSLLLISNPLNEEQYASSLAYLRTFLDEILREISCKIERLSNNPMEKESESEFVKFKKYLKKNDIIDDKEAKLLGSIHSNLSGKGSHNLSLSYERYILHLNSTLVFIVYLLKNIRSFFLEKGIGKKEALKDSFCFISEPEFETLFNEATKQRNQMSSDSRKRNMDQYRLAMLLAFESGMRIGEIRELKPHQIDFEAGKINVVDRVVLKPPRANKNIKQLLPLTLSARGLQKYIKALGERILGRKDVKFQSLRHGFGIKLAKMKTDVVDIANMMDIRTSTASLYYEKIKNVEHKAINASF